MPLFAAVEIGVFILVGLFVGLRLLLLWTRTRQIPELCASIALVTLGPVGFSMSVTAIQISATRPAAARVCTVIGMAAAAIGTTAVAFFTQRVYRHESAVWSAATWGTAAFLALASAGAAWSDDLDIVRTPGLWRNAAQVVEIGVFLWGGTESLVYAGFMRRRTRDGTADLAAVHKIALWGFAQSLAAIALTLRFMTVSAPDVRLRPWLEGSIAGTGTLAACALIFAFFPPAFYKAWIARRSASYAARAQSSR